MANQGPQHQDFTTLHAQKQFQKLPDDAGLTGFSVPHNLAFLPTCEITTIHQPTLSVLRSTESGTLVFRNWDLVNPQITQITPIRGKADILSRHQFDGRRGSFIKQP